MARDHYLNESVVSGMKIGDILEMSPGDWPQLEISDLRKIVGRVVSAANKRVRNLQKAGLDSPALRELMVSGGQLSTKGLTTKEDLWTELLRGKQFMEDKRSSVKGIKQAEKQFKVLTRRYLGKVPDDVKSSTEYDRFWRVYEELKRVDERAKKEEFKYDILREISAADVIDDDGNLMSVGEIANNLQSRLDTIYAGHQEMIGQMESVGDLLKAPKREKTRSSTKTGPARGKTAKTKSKKSRTTKSRTTKSRTTRSKNR